MSKVKVVSFTCVISMSFVSFHSPSCISVISSVPNVDGLTGLLKFTVTVVIGVWVKVLF